MREDIIAMSTQEVKRLKIMPKVLDRQLTQAKAGEVLGISERQVRRLVKSDKGAGSKRACSSESGAAFAPQDAQRA